MYARETKAPKQRRCVSKRNCQAESESAKRQETGSKKEVVSESVEFIGIHITWQAPNGKLIFAPNYLLP